MFQINAIEPNETYVLCLVPDILMMNNFFMKLMNLFE
jgi:hypothetical protein